MPSEIERKFLITELPPDIDNHSFKEILQGYIVITDGKEVRIRKKGNSYYQTVKIGEGLIRKETEIEISKEQFETLWPLTESLRIEKIRYEINYMEYLIELDVYSGLLADLVVAEVEFQTEVESKSFIPPDWFGSEITDDERFKNKNLALLGIPES